MKQHSGIFEKLKREFPKIQKNVSMKDYTTFKIGGNAEYFLLADSESELLGAIRLAKEFRIDTFVMGGGSNLLVLDQGIKGLVVKNHILNPIALKDGAMVDAPAGAVLGDVVEFALAHSLAGLEWAGGLPGSFGGAIRGNAGAFGGEIKDSVFEVRALDANYDLQTLSRDQCAFSYRNSLFKQKSLVVLSATLKLAKGDQQWLQEISDAHKQYRKDKHPLEYPNAGSIFKNVAVKDIAPALQEEFKDKVKQDPFPIVPAAWFIIGAGLTGTTIGKAQISKKHSNYIVNLGGASSSDVLELIALAQQKVQEKYGIALEVEVQYVGN